MANMGYCRFENTLQDLVDCEEHLYDDLSESEKRARRKMIKLCIQIAENFGDFELDEDSLNDMDV